MRTTARWAPAMLAVLLLAACGGGDDGGGAPVSSATEVAVGDMDHADGDHMHTLVVSDGKVKGDRRIEVPQGTEVMLTIESDVADEVHVHGYDVTAEVAPGSPADITFTADVTGIFEVELESSGLLLTEVEVTP